MANDRNRSNPLALAVLVLLFERSMHPYEMAATLKERRKEDSIKLRYGSLYTVINALQKEGLIAPRKKHREGRRPERTVFELTPPGREEMRTWMRSILSTPAKEFPQFEAGLSLMPALPPDDVKALLEARAVQLRRKADALKAGHALAREQGLNPLFLIESEFERAMTEAERRFVEQLVRNIGDERWEPLKIWREIHRKRSGKKT